MTDDLEDKYVRFVAKLIELTQAGSLVWKAVSEERYRSFLNGRTLEVSKKDAAASNVQALPIGISFTQRRKDYTLHIGKTEDADMFSIKNRYGVQNLYTSVELTSTKVENFMDSVLRENK